MFVRKQGHWVAGLVLSHRMSKLASGRLDTAVTADLRSLPLGDGQVGGLLAFYALIHVRRPALGGVLREFCRVLRPGGRGAPDGPAICGALLPHAGHL